MALVLAVAAGAPCRDYSIDAPISGARDKVVGTACRQLDAIWRVAQ
jgi:surface antigen